MGVLSFRNFIQSGQPQSCDWTQQEIADFYRAYHLLQRNGVSIGIDRGLTDKGDPWLVFFDATSQDVFLHMARIDGRCILVSEALGINFKAWTIPELIGRLEETVCRLVSDRAERGRNVVIHPAARIIMAVSAVFLLFKFDNGSNAYAKSESSSLDEALRKQEVGVQARVQAALGRLMESIDTPTVIAAAAGVILTRELLKPSGDQGGAAALAHEVTDLAQPLSLNDADSDGLLPLEVQSAALVGIHEAIEAVSSEAAPAEVSFLAELAGITADLFNSFEAAVVRKAEAAEPVETEVITADTGGATPRFAASMQAASVDLLVPTLSGAPASPQDLPSGQADKFKPSEYISVNIDPEKNKESEPVVAPELEPADHPWEGGEIGISDLSALSGQVGFYKQSSVSGIEASEILKYFYAHFDAFEMETSNGSAMIEQVGTDQMAVDDMGIWQNVMANGLVLSVVGSASLIAEIDSLL